jgi:hypothetical protein
MRDGVWEAWLEFNPLGGGSPLVTSRETTQPNRTDTEYWATGLTIIYLEGALQRALHMSHSPSAAQRLQTHQA